MAKKATATVTFTLKDGTVKTFKNHPITIQSDGSVDISLPQGRIVPGTDSKVVIDINGKTFSGTATSKAGANNTTEVTLPAGTVSGAAVA